MSIKTDLRLFLGILAYCFDIHNSQLTWWIANPTHSERSEDYSYLIQSRMPLFSFIGTVSQLSFPIGT